MNLLERALATQGHMSEAELRWLNSACEGKGLAIEFGAWCGRSSVAMASARSLVCVDTWLGSPGEECEQQVRDGRVDPWREWLAATAGLTNVAARRGELRDAAFTFRLVEDYGGLADLVFVDASHDEASVRQDIALARELLKPGGVLCGHDYGDWTGWPGVKAAVDALVRNPRAVAGAIWIEGD